MQVLNDKIMDVVLVQLRIAIRQNPIGVKRLTQHRIVDVAESGSEKVSYSNRKY